MPTKNINLKIEKIDQPLINAKMSIGSMRAYYICPNF